MGAVNYDNKSFRPVDSSANSNTSEETIFHYQQQNNIITATYSGGQIISGHLTGTVDDNGTIKMWYHHINTAGELMAGKCTSVPEIMSNGKIRLHENWQWATGDKSSGQSVIEEI